MNIFDTPLGKDVSKVIRFNGQASTAAHLDMEWVVAGRKNIPITRIHALHTVRDYREASFDMITAIVEVSVEDYQSILYPHRAGLLMNLYRTEASARGVYKNNRPVPRRYKVMLLTNEDHELFDQTYSGNNSREKSNNVMLISIQLIEYNMYLYKDVEYSTILGPGSIEDYLHYFMSHRGKLICNIHPIDNKDDAEDIVIPEGIEMLNLANWMQRHGPGLYNHGINTYYQKDIMHVYPIALLSPHKHRIKVNIFRAGSDLGIGTGNTYAVIDGTLNLISAGEALLPDGEQRMIDEREALEQEYGNVVRWNSPVYQSTVIDETNDMMRYTSRGSHVYGLSDVDIKVEKIHRTHTANPYGQRSIINKTLGRVITIPWHSGNIDLLIPGTEVTYYYMKGKSMEYVQGIVEGTIESLTPQEGNMKENVFNIGTTLRLRVE